jgi:beta-glucosidase
MSLSAEWRDLRLAWWTLSASHPHQPAPAFNAKSRICRSGGDTATAMPACIALGASFNPALAGASGGAIGREARSRGFNVQLGGINLLRNPRNGRSFEYLSEDPSHRAVLAAEVVNGIQAEGAISTLKHFCLNCNETNRHWLDAIIDPDAHRESDLLAFQIAIERSQPAAICASGSRPGSTRKGSGSSAVHSM